MWVKIILETTKQLKCRIKWTRTLQGPQQGIHSGFGIVNQMSIYNELVVDGFGAMQLVL